MTPAERRTLLSVVAKALDAALANEALESPEEIAAVVVDELLSKYAITSIKGGN